MGLTTEIMSKEKLIIGVDIFEIKIKPTVFVDRLSSTSACAIIKRRKCKIPLTLLYSESTMKGEQINSEPIQLR